MPADLSISVVIPTFNNAETLREAIESALRQHSERLEVVVVDDGSTDETSTVVNELAARDARLRVLSQENAGAAAARNAGIKAASCDYVAFLDADDYWSQEKLATQIEMLARDPAISVCFTGYAVHAQGSQTDVVLPSWDPHKVAVLESLLQGCCVATSTVAARREAILRVGLFDTSLRCCEDHDLWFRLALAGERFAYTPLVLTHERARTSSLSADESEVARCSDLVYERLFASGKLPDEIQAQRRFYLARCYLNSACRHLAHQDGPASLSSLCRAVRTRKASIRPGWVGIAARASALALNPANRGRL